MKLVIACCIAAGLFVACSDKDRIPGDVLSQDEMGKVMWDMIQADRFSAQFLMKDSVKRDIKPEMFTLYDQVFQLHKISREEFTKSYRFYVSRPDIARVMFDSLVTKVSRIKNAAADSINKKQDPPPPATLKPVS
ncbi:MAG: DUF4296 domain-containing protein [Chitinophagaceae bacterium]